MNKFIKLGINNNTLENIKDLGYKQPTEIQEKAIPLIIQGNDIIAKSATGTGKTLAFLSAILAKINNKDKIQAIIITPTRELAIQIHQEAKILSKNSVVKSCVVYGGESIRNQKLELRHSNIVIATPGRLLDLIKRGYVNLKKLRYLILDEADRMCDMGFIDDVKKILDVIPKKRQILLFSATITKDVKEIEKKYMSNIKKVFAKEYVDKSKLIQEYYKVPENRKLSLLVHLILENNEKSIVFCNTRSMVDVIEYNLKINKIKVYKLHGGLEQRRRTRIISEFHKEKNCVLVATDVASRGIHVSDIKFIYNFNLPRDYTLYIHRIGRTARAGDYGKAISFIKSKDFNVFMKICKKYNFNPTLKKLPDFKYLDLKKPIKSSNELYTTKKKEYFKRKKKILDNKIKKQKKRIEKEELSKKEFLERKEKIFRNRQRRDKAKQKVRLKEKKYFKKRF